MNEKLAQINHKSVEIVIPQRIKILTTEDFGYSLQVVMR